MKITSWLYREEKIKISLQFCLEGLNGRKLHRPVPALCIRVGAIPKCSAVLHAQQRTAVRCLSNPLLCRSDTDTCLASVMTNKNCKFSYLSLPSLYTVPDELEGFFPPCFLPNHIISKIVIFWTHIYREILPSECFQPLNSLKFIFTFIFKMLLYDLENEICPKMENWSTADSCLTCSPWCLKLICPLF